MARTNIIIRLIKSALRLRPLHLTYYHITNILFQFQLRVTLAIRNSESNTSNQILKLQSVSSINILIGTHTNPLTC